MTKVVEVTSSAKFKLSPISHFNDFFKVTLSPFPRPD